jgi:hypothetical protein
MKQKWFVLAPVLLLVLAAFAFVPEERPAWAQTPDPGLDCHYRKKVYLPLIARPAETSSPTPIPTPAPSPIPTQATPAGAAAEAPGSEPGLNGQAGSN